MLSSRGIGRAHTQHIPPKKRVTFSGPVTSTRVTKTQSIGTAGKGAAMKHKNVTQHSSTKHKSSLASQDLHRKPNEGNDLRPKNTQTLFSSPSHDLHNKPPEVIGIGLNNPRKGKNMGLGNTINNTNPVSYSPSQDLYRQAPYVRGMGLKDNTKTTKLIPSSSHQNSEETTMFERSQYNRPHSKTTVLGTPLKTRMNCNHLRPKCVCSLIKKRGKAKRKALSGSRSSLNISRRGSLTSHMAGRKGSFNSHMAGTRAVNYRGRKSTSSPNTLSSSKNKSIASHTLPLNSVHTASWRSTSSPTHTNTLNSHNTHTSTQNPPHKTKTRSNLKSTLSHKNTNSPQTVHKSTITSHHLGPRNTLMSTRSFPRGEINGRKIYTEKGNPTSFLDSNWKPQENSEGTDGNGEGTLNYTRENNELNDYDREDNDYGGRGTNNYTGENGLNRPNELRGDYVRQASEETSSDYSTDNDENFTVRQTKRKTVKFADSAGYSDNTRRERRRQNSSHSTRREAWRENSNYNSHSSRRGARRQNSSDNTRREVHNDSSSEHHTQSSSRPDDYCRLCELARADFPEDSEDYRERREETLNRDRVTDRHGTLGEKERLRERTLSRERALGRERSLDRDRERTRKSSSERDRNLERERERNLNRDLNRDAILKSPPLPSYSEIPSAPYLTSHPCSLCQSYGRNHYYINGREYCELCERDAENGESRESVLERGSSLKESRLHSSSSLKENTLRIKESKSRKENIMNLKGNTSLKHDTVRPKKNILIENKSYSSSLKENAKSASSKFRPPLHRQSSSSAVYMKPNNSNRERENSNVERDSLHMERDNLYIERPPIIPYEPRTELVKDLKERLETEYRRYDYKTADKHSEHRWKSWDAEDAIRLSNTHHDPNLEHKCIHRYQQNDRLFLEPTLINGEGVSVCSQCGATQPSNNTQPSHSKTDKTSQPSNTKADPYLYHITLGGINNNNNDTNSNPSISRHVTNPSKIIPKRSDSSKHIYANLNNIDNPFSTTKMSKRGDTSKHIYAKLNHNIHKIMPHDARYYFRTQARRDRDVEPHTKRPPSRSMALVDHLV